MSRRALLVLAVLVAAAAGLAVVIATSTDGAEGSPEIAALCQVLDFSTKGRADEAERVFLGRLHNDLHVLAAAAADADRRASGRLLEAKQVIEADVRGSRPADWRGLLAAARAAVVATGARDPGGCQA